MTVKTGHEMKLYMNSGSHETPTWTLIDEVGDVSIPDLAIGLAELKRRKSNFTKNLAGTFQSIAVEFQLSHDGAAANFKTLIAAFFARTVKEWAIMDGAITTTGSAGLRIPLLIEQFPWDQPQDDVSGHAVRLAVALMEDPAGTELDPSWYEITAG
jgi:hypothetical protein